jgi:hypothetical protein
LIDSSFATKSLSASQDAEHQRQDEQDDGDPKEKARTFHGRAGDAENPGWRASLKY